MNLSNLQSLVIDEVDQMVSLNFKDDIEFIMAELKKQREERSQFLLFSASIPKWAHDMVKTYMDPDHVYLDLAKDLTNKTNSNI